MAKVWKWQKTHFQDASTRTWQQRWNKSQWQSPGWILTLNLKQFSDLQNGQWWKWWWRSWVGGTVARTEGISSDTWLSSRGFPLLAVSTGQCPPPLQLGEASFATHVCAMIPDCPMQVHNLHCKLPLQHICAQCGPRGCIMKQQYDGTYTLESLTRDMCNSYLSVVCAQYVQYFILVCVRFVPCQMYLC